MTWAKRIRRAVASVLVIGLITIGAVSATHSHAEAGGDGCVACRVAHSAALAPVAASPVLVLTSGVALGIPHFRLVSAVPSRDAAPRAPPALLS
ncbi:MAG: hypothetical protein ABR538_13625 [Candidatus Binatia bacterium]